MQQRIEVELRTFISDEDYTRLRILLDQEGELVEDTQQETWYFDKESHLRVVRGDKKAKICFKGGLTHDEGRAEVDLPIAREHVEAAHALLRGLGHEVQVLWLRHRRRYLWRGMDAALDDTQGYGKILELELLVDPGKEPAALEQLRATFTDLGLSLTPREEFEEQYKEYLATWRERTTAP